MPGSSALPARGPGAAWVVHHLHRHGCDVRLYATDALAHAAVAELARNWWPEIAWDDGAPATPDGLSDADAIRIYFDHHASECCTVDLAQVIGAGGGAVEIAGAAAGAGRPSPLSEACAGGECGDCVRLPDGRLCEHECHYRTAHGYYRNVITVEVLSNEPWGDEVTDLRVLRYQITDGQSSGAVARTVVNEQVTAGRMAELLTAQGSNPEFLLECCGQCGAYLAATEGEGYGGLCGTCADKAAAGAEGVTQ
jgi:hypothetical protein